MDFPASPTIGQRYTFGGKTWEYNGEGWAFVAGGTTATPGGSSTQIQYNDGGILGGDPDFTYNKTTNELTIASGIIRHNSGGYARIKPLNSTSSTLILEPTAPTNTTSFMAYAYDAIAGGSGGVTGDNHYIAISGTGGAPSNYLHVDKIGTGTYAIYKSIAIGWGPATGLVSSGTAIYMQANTTTGALQQVVINGTSIDGTGAALRVVGALNVTGNILNNGTNINTIYASSGHTHSLNAMTNVNITSPTTGQLLSYNGAQWVNTNPTGLTDLTWTASTRTIASSTGNDAILTLFSPTLDGLTPASGGGTTNFLRADGTWAAPAETGQVSLQFQDEGSNLGASGTVDTLDFTGSNLTAARVGNKVTVSFTGAIGSGITYTYSATEPATPAAGDEWVDSTAGILYKYIFDGDTGQWVDFSGSGAPIFTSTLPGIVPASGGGTANFLRADGTWVAPAGTGTVTSVGLSLPAIFNVTNSPVTTTGTLTGSLASQSQNLFFASPNGSAGTPTFRSIAAADLPTITTTKGGTNITSYTTGDLLYASATDTLAKLPAGTNTYVLTMVAGVPAWAAATAGATDLSYTASTRLLASSTGADVTLPLFTSTEAGLVPLSGGGTSNYLRADGTWATPPGGGGGTPGGSSTQVQYNNAGSFGGITNLTTDGTNLTAATIAGNLTFSGTARRLIADSTDNTFANRFTHQSSVTNGGSYPQIAPNGTSTSAGLIVLNNSDLTNAATVGISVEATRTTLDSWRIGTGTALPLQIRMGNTPTAAMTFQVNGNVNVGSTTTDQSVKFNVEGGMQQVGTQGVTTKSSGSSLGFTFYDRASTPGEQFIFQGNNTAGTYGSVVNISHKGGSLGAKKGAAFALWNSDITVDSTNAEQFQIANNQTYEGVIFTQRYGTGVARKISLHADWNGSSTPTQVVLNTDGTTSFGSRIDTAATTTTTAGLRLPHGTAPTSPVNGDVWTTTAGMYARINGSTVGPFGAGGGTPAGSTGELQYNNAGSFAATSLVSIDTSVRHFRLGDEASPWIITPKTSTSANTAGQALTVRGATANGDAAGGTLYLDGGAASAGNSSGGSIIMSGKAGNGTGSGGDVTIYGGAGATSGLGGDITLQSGAGGGSNAAAGVITLQGGTGGATAGAGGPIIITGGSGNNAAGGSLTLTGGSSTASTGGSVSLIGGTALTPGNVTLQAGATNNAAYDGGNVYVRTGAPGASGLDGSVFIQTAAGAANLMTVFGETGNVNIGTTGTDPSAKLRVEGLLLTTAAATGTAGFRLPHGTAPTSPVNGDVWTTTGGIYVQVNGSTVGPLGTGGGGTPAGADTQVQFNNAGAFGADDDFTWNSTTRTLALGTVGGLATISIPNNLTFNGDTLFIDSTNSRVGLGTATPEATLHVRSQGTGNTRGILLQHVDNTTAFSHAKFIGRRSRGSNGSPTAVLQDDSLVGFISQGYKATGWSATTGGLYVYAAENWTDTATGTYVTIRGPAPGGTTVSERVRFEHLKTTFTGGIITAAGTTALASVRMPHGVAPTSPVDGDVWTTTAGMYVRVNGGTVGPLGTGGGATAGGSNKQIQYNNSTAFAGAAGFEWDSATTTLSLSNAASRTPAVAVTYGATTTIDCRTGQLFRVALTGNITTLTLNNAADGQTITVLFVQDATGGRTVVWPASFNWVGQTAPLLSTTANYIDVLTATYSSTDAKWLCTLGAQNATAANLPGGSNTQVQFNDSGVLNGSTALTINKTTGTTTIAALTGTALAVTQLAGQIGATIYRSADADSSDVQLQVGFSGQRNLNFSARVSNSSYNPTVTTSDSVIWASHASLGSGVLNLTAHSATSVGIRISGAGTINLTGTNTNTGTLSVTSTFNAQAAANVTGMLTVGSSAAGTTGSIYLSNATNNQIYFVASGLGAPTFTTRSAGTKIVLYPQLSGSASDYAIGMESALMWFSSPTTSAGFRWYTGTTVAATLHGTGNLNLGTATADPTQKLTVEGNVFLTGNGRKILGDMSTATAANRFALQTSVTNGTTVPWLIPNGTGDGSGWGFIANSALSNGQPYFAAGVTSTAQFFDNLTVSGTGTSVPTQFRTNDGGVLKVVGRIYANGNWNIGSSTSDPGVKFNVEGTTSVAGALTVTTAKTTLAATAAGYASLNLPHGTAPSSPADGDVWTTTAGIYVRVNGGTVGPLAAAGAPVAPNYEEFVATAAQTVFNTTMTTTAKGSGKAYLQVFVNGVLQQEGATKKFTVTGANQITFNAGLALNDDVAVFGFA